MKFSFYRADALYCDYLRKSDPCVPYTMDQKEARPFIGIVLTLNDYDYYAPLTSPKPKHLHMNHLATHWLSLLLCPHHNHLLLHR